MEKSKNYVALMGDLINSKELEHRNEVQKQLKNALTKINQRYSEEIASDFMITLGDEFQGLLLSKKSILPILNDIEQELHPYRLRFGIGEGPISTDILERCSEIDGVAFHRARKMIQTIKESTSRHNRAFSSILLCSNHSYDSLINSIFSLCTTLKEKWSQRQIEIIQAYLKSEKNQYLAAKALGITQSSVNKALKASNFYAYHQALSTITTFFSQEEDLS